MVLNWEDKNNFKLQNDDAAVAYIERMPVLDKEVQQCNQYDYSWFDNWCVVASAFTCLCTFFSKNPNVSMMRKFEEKAEENGRDLWRDGIPLKYMDDASKMIISLWNKLYEDKKSVFLQDMMFSPTWKLSSKKLLPMQYVVITTDEWRKQKKTGKITDPRWEKKGWHAIAGIYNTDKEEMTFYDSNEWDDGDIFTVDKKVLRIMMREHLISPICRLYLPLNDIHDFDEKTYKALQMYKNVSVAMMGRVDDDEFDEAIQNLNLVVDKLLWE